MEARKMICDKCVMDESAEEIIFDENGICNFCKEYQEKKMNLYYGEERRQRLIQLVEKIKKEKKGKYDIILGISGGVDSSYLAYKLKELGLKILAVTVDNGWDTDISKKNVKNICKQLKIPLYTYCLDWEEFKDLQLSFLKASVPDLEIPTDHAIVAVLYKVAEENNIKYIARGRNFVTEAILPESWSQGHSDWKYIKSIQKQFGTKELKKFPHFDLIKGGKLLLKFKRIAPLDYMDYNREEAKAFLIKELEWEDYGGKHMESVYTRFVQGLILPIKFGFDKRKAHLSTEINAGTMDRKTALEILEEQPYDEKLMIKDRKTILEKLDINQEQFNEYMSLPNKSIDDYPSYKKILKLMKRFKND